MASRSVSPGGALLRASRVFSIPPPLPRTLTDLSSTAIFQSESATLPHPIHQSITTPQSSRARGDWGFKRPLPLRSTTKTSTPIIRVESIDTHEHISDFASAADHSLTLQKWLEMGLPVTTPPTMTAQTRATEVLRTHGKGISQSVFEDFLDSTVHVERGLLDKDDTRWKFKGPWLAGLSEGEFKTYIQQQIKGRKLEFREFLRTACAENMTRAMRTKAQDEGGEIEAPVQASAVTEAQLDLYIRQVRHEINTVNNLLRKFLDLPPPPTKSLSDELLQLPAYGSIDLTKEAFNVSNSPYADTGPPKTHPSAGLSYIRTSSYMFNHPVYGPQKYKAPVQARVVMPKMAAVGNFAPVLGVGGFAVTAPQGESSFDTRNIHKRGGIGRGHDPLVPGLLHIETDKVGGSKVWVEPKSASIDPKGRVMVLISAANPEAVAVKEERAHEIPARGHNYIDGLASRHGLSKDAITKTPADRNVVRTVSSRGSGYGYGISGRDFLGGAEG